MSGLVVHTARISSSDPDRLDDWEDYVVRYTDEMRASYRQHGAAWASLLGRERVVLVCFCVDPLQCHRTVLGRDILPKLGAAFAGELP